MPGLEISFEIEGDVQMVRQLQGISRDLKDWTPEFRKTGSSLSKTFKDNFDSEGSMLGRPWARLQPTTLAQKVRRGHPANILQGTGKMKNSFESSPGKFEVVIRNTAPYFPYHQSNQPRRKLPRRVMMRLDEKRKQQIVKIFQDSIQDTLKRRSK